MPRSCTKYEVSNKSSSWTTTEVPQNTHVFLHEHGPHTDRVKHTHTHTHKGRLSLYPNSEEKYPKDTLTKPQH